MLELKIEKRDSKSNLNFLRKGGKMPAVFYGKKETSTPIAISYVDFKKVWKEAGSSSLVTLNGIDGKKEVLIYDVDIDPVSNQVRHADFYVVERGKVMEVSVPLEFVGNSPAVKNFGGILVKVLHELEIEVLPKDLPQSIQVDISSLENLESQILVRDLILPQGVRALNEEDEVVASVSAENEENPEVNTADISAVEIEKKGKKETEEDKK